MSTIKVNTIQEADGTAFNFGNWTYGTATDYTNLGANTDLSFSGWPTTWQKIKISFTNVSSASNAYIQYFVSKSSTASNRIQSGYNVWTGYFGHSDSANSTGSDNDMARFSYTADSNYSMTGWVDFEKFSSTRILMSGSLMASGYYQYHTQGYVDCDPTTDMTHIFFRCQGLSYDSGIWKLDYMTS